MIRILLSMLSGLFLSYSWPEIGFFPFIFISFIPLLILEDEISKSNNNTSWKVFGLSFLTFLIFNIFTTYWVWNAIILGAIAAFVVNSLLMGFVFVLFHKVKKVLGYKIGYIAFIVFWISFEYLHLHWELAWPWLTLGNVFAKNTDLVQWYEFTGVLGGTLWVLLINFLLFNWWNTNRKRKDLMILLLCLLFPAIISFAITKDYDGEEIEVVIIQPNIHSYQESLGGWIEEEFYIDSFINIVRKELTQNTTLLIAPETVLQGYLDEINPNYRFKLYVDTLVRKYNGDIDKLIQQLQQEYPKLNILLGSATGKAQQKSDKYIDKYNSAIFISKKQDISIHHKTKLVPGAEAIPYPLLFNKLKDFFYVGGVAGNYVKGKDISIFNMDGVQILPLICYESVFGDIITNKSLDLIAIITNDGWWRNTAGYKQHFDYARLRAIEQRKSVVRSANTGISGLIHPDGEVIKQTKWDEEVVFRVSVPINNDTTFYNHWGDYIGRISLLVTILLILIAFVKSKIRTLIS